MQIKKAIFKQKIARKFNTISEDVKVMVEQSKEGWRSQQQNGARQENMEGLSMKWLSVLVEIPTCD